MNNIKKCSGYGRRDFLINADYIGVDTHSEIEYADKAGSPVSYLGQ